MRFWPPPEDLDVAKPPKLKKKPRLDKWSLLWHFGGSKLGSSEFECSEKHLKKGSNMVLKVWIPKMPKHFIVLPGGG